MNFNKCERCGSFFMSKDCVCPNCRARDNNDINQLKNFLEDSDSSVTVEALSAETGVSLKNVNRFLKDKKINSTFTDLGLTDTPTHSNWQF